MDENNESGYKAIELDGVRLPYTDKEILAMKTITVKDNTIKGLRYGGGYRGRGGSNQSGYTEGGGAKLMLADLDGAKPYFLEADLYIRAVVNDIVYVSNKSSGYVFAFDARKGFYCSYAVAYDTEQSFSIDAIEDNGNK